jgi:hypothetical protein
MQLKITALFLLTLFIFPDISRSITNIDDRFFVSTESSSNVAKRYWSKVIADSHGGNNQRTISFWGSPSSCKGNIGPSMQFELIGDKYYPTCAGSKRKGPSFDADVIDTGTRMHQIHTEAAADNSASAFLFPYNNLGQTGQGTNSFITATYVDLNPAWNFKPWGMATTNNLSSKTRAVFITRQKTSTIQLTAPTNSQLQQVISFGFLNTACFNDVSIRNASPTICQFQINIKTFNKGLNAYSPKSNAELYSDAAQGSIGVILGPVGPSGHVTKLADGQVAWTSFGDEMQTDATGTTKKFQIEITWEEALNLFKKLSNDNPIKSFGPTWNVGKDWVLINAQYGQEVYRDPSVLTPTFIEGMFQDLEVLSVSESEAVTCSSFTYSDWGTCQKTNSQSRTILSSAPINCTGGSPVTSQACNDVLLSNCQTGTFQFQNQTYEFSCGCGNVADGVLQPNGCFHRLVTPITPATPASCSSFTYSEWGTCQKTNSQSRTVLSNLPANCTGGSPVTTQACTYVPPVTCTTGTFQFQNQTYEFSCGCGNVADGVLQPDGCYHRLVVAPITPATCSSFTYSEWGTCQKTNSQSRTVLSNLPANCIGGSPVTTQACTYVPPVVCTTGTFQFQNQTYEFSCGCGNVPGGVLQSNGCFHRAVP